MLCRLNSLITSKTDSNHSYRGFNFLAEEDASLLRLLLRGEFASSSLTNRALLFCIECDMLQSTLIIW